MKSVQTEQRPGLPVEVRQLHKAFHPLGAAHPLVAIERLSFSVEAGETVCMVGRTGCGKSTLFNILAGLSSSGRGAALLAGRLPTRNSTGFRAASGSSFSRTACCPGGRRFNTPNWDWKFRLEIQGLSPTSCQERAARWLSRLGLEDSLDRYPGELSGGMR